MYVCLYVCMHVCMCVCAYVCMHACMYVCACACACAYVWIQCECVCVQVLHKATFVPDKVARALLGKEKDQANLPVAQKVWKSVKLWSMYADLEESLGTLESTMAVYDRMIELKVITPQILINYAHLLEEHKHFEDSFRVYEKGVNAFDWPLSKELWIAYLAKFVKRYEGKKIERARDLFEQALSKIPPEESKSIFLMYAQLEEQHGLVKNAMGVYERACKSVAPPERHDLYVLYINKATEFFGVTKTRPIYETAMQYLPDSRIKDMAVKYADLEMMLGEIDRARGIYNYGSQHCDPGKDNTLWSKWHEFEVRHGNEDTFREMLRIKRSVQLQYTQQHVNTSDTAAALIQQGPAAKKQKLDNDMERLERQMMDETMKSFADAPSQSRGGDIVAMGGDEESAVPATAAAHNTDEIALDDDEDEMVEDAGPTGKQQMKKMNLEERAIPAAVYGGLMPEGEGALARFRSQK